MTDQISFLIVGNGIAGVTAAETLRTEAPEATIGVISDDAHPVYFRPALKDFLAGRIVEDKLWARPAQYYQSQRIHFLSGRVARIDTNQHVALLQGGGQIKYEKLLLASGASSARLSCPGCDLPGVTTLRSVEDYQAVLERLPEVRRVVVCGSGTLALETVETLRHRGLAVSHLLRKRLLWSDVLDATASDLVLQEEIRAGVDVRLETEITEIQASRGAVSAVMTSTGERIACDLVLVAIGIEPQIEYVRGSGIVCKRGVLVNQQMQTNIPTIYAAGDVVETALTGTQRYRLVGQWYPAIQQARAAAYSMLGILDTTQPFHTEAFYNATFLYGLPFASMGLTNVKGYRELIADPKPRSYRKVLLCDGVPVGMLALGDRKHTLAFKRAIDHQVNLDSVAADLLKEDFDLAACLDRWHVPPLQLGVQRAGNTIATPTQQQGGSSGGDLMLNQLSQSKHTEAFLVHIPDPRLALHVAEAPLSRDEILTVGRQPGVHLVANEGSISRRHAHLGYRSGHYTVTDLTSSNGTFLNGKRLDPEYAYQLATNDVLRFGNMVSFRFLLRTLDLSTLASPSGKQPVVTPSTPMKPAITTPVAPVKTPVVRIDERLLPAGAAQPLPAAVVNALKETPALIVVPTTPKGEKKQSPQVYLLQESRSLTIGREVGNDIELIDMIVSRRHAEVFAADGDFYIQDSGSSNGVVVNQRQIEQPYRLSHGDHILLGNTLLFFVDLQSGQEKTSMMAVAKPPRIEKKSTPFRAPPTGLETSARIPAATTALRPVVRTEKTPIQVVVCPKCGVVNMPIARFCAGCSTLLHTS